MKNTGKNIDVAPVLQSMQDYIINHYTDELLDEVSAAIQLQLVENLEIEAKGGTFVLDRTFNTPSRRKAWEALSLSAHQYTCHMKYCCDRP